MGRKNFNAGTLMAPLPAVMVSVGNMEKSNIITVAWTGILSSDPPRTYISVRPSRYSHEILKSTGEFVINLTNESLALATDFSGIYTGAKVDKFEKLSLTKSESKCVKAPTIAEAPLALECKVFNVVESGTHDIFMADIVNVSCDEKLLDENGKICFDRANLIAYSHGEYYSLGEKVGKFGFSTDKRNKRSSEKNDTAENSVSRQRRNGDKTENFERTDSKGEEKAKVEKNKKASHEGNFYSEFIKKKRKSASPKRKNKPKSAKSRGKGTK